VVTYLPTAILDGFGIVSIVSGGVVIIFGRTSRLNTATANELITNLQKLREADKEEFNYRIQALEALHIEDQKQHVANVTAIANLQGQIQTYKDIPLQKLAAAMESLKTDSRANADTNAKILETLQASAVVLAKDTSSVAAATERVRSTLEHHKDDRGASIVNINPAAA
jgi:hypothetical protein